MSPISIVVLLTMCFTLQSLPSDQITEQHKAEIIRNADRLFGQRYRPPKGKLPRLYDEKTEIGPPDTAIYRHGATYVTELIFAPDGSIARIQLVPEALLYSHNWANVPEGTTLHAHDLQWFTNAANKLQSIGKTRNLSNPPAGCLQSGRNLYCSDSYGEATVSHYHVEKPNGRILLEDIAILYIQRVSGIVDDVRMVGNQRQLKIGSIWYHGEKPGSPVFRDADKGSLVRVISFGCAGSEEACLADPE